MRRMWLAGCTLWMFTGCVAPSPEETKAEHRRFAERWTPHREEYLRSLREADAATQESLDWLRGEAMTAPRTQAVSGARKIMDRWAKIHFVPRVIHENLRFDEFRSSAIQERQKRLLDRLRREYVEWHDYQRYAQYAWQNEMHGAPPGRLPPQLEEFKKRLEARRSVEGDLTDLP